MSEESEIRRVNLGARRLPKLPAADFPNADGIVRGMQLNRPRPESAVDVLLVNPPTPDGGLWIRTQHRVGRRTRENMVWPQVSLAQMAKPRPSCKACPLSPAGHLRAGPSR